MGIEVTLKVLLGPLVDGRVYPDVIPDNPQFPLIVYQQVGGLAGEYADQSLPDHEHARVQVVTWSQTRLEASSLARQSRAAILAGARPAQTYGAPVSQHEGALKLYGSRTDYGLWYVP